MALSMNHQQAFLYYIFYRDQVPGAAITEIPEQRRDFYKQRAKGIGITGLRSAHEGTPALILLLSLGAELVRDRRCHVIAILAQLFAEYYFGELRKRPKTSPSLGSGGVFERFPGRAALPYSFLNK